MSEPAPFYCCHGADEGKNCGNIMAELTVHHIFDTAVRIQLLERAVVITFTAGKTLSIKFPTTRRISEFMGVPHYRVLRCFSCMEREGLVRKEERAGIVTTHEGSKMLLALMRNTYRRETESILGTTVFEELLGYL